MFVCACSRLCVYRPVVPLCPGWVTWVNCAARSNANSVLCPSTRVDIGSLYPLWMASQRPNSSPLLFFFSFVCPRPHRPPPPPPLSFVLMFPPPLDLCWLLCSCPRCWNVAGTGAAFQSDGWDLLRAPQLSLSWELGTLHAEDFLFFFAIVARLSENLYVGNGVCLTWRLLWESLHIAWWKIGCVCGF